MANTQLLTALKAHVAKITETVRRLGVMSLKQALDMACWIYKWRHSDTTYTIGFYAKTVNGNDNINIDNNDAAPFGGQSVTITGEWTRL